MLRKLRVRLYYCKVLNMGANSEDRAHAGGSSLFAKFFFTQVTSYAAVFSLHYFPVDV